MRTPPRASVLKVYGTFPYGHMGLKNLTAETQLAMIREHQVR